MRLSGRHSLPFEAHRNTCRGCKCATPVPGHRITVETGNWPRCCHRKPFSLHSLLVDSTRKAVAECVCVCVFHILKETVFWSYSEANVCSIHDSSGGYKREKLNVNVSNDLVLRLAAVCVLFLFCPDNPASCETEGHTSSNWNLGRKFPVQPDGAWYNFTIGAQKFSPHGNHTFIIIW